MVTPSHTAIPERVASPRARFAIAFAILLFVVSCQQDESRKPARPLTRATLVTGPIGGGSFPLGREIAEAINKGLTDVEIQTVVSAGAVSNIRAIQEDKADLALTFADVAYLSFNGQLTSRDLPFDQVRGIAVLQVTPVALVVRPGLQIRGPKDLRGRRVGVGPDGSGTEVTASLILQAYGLAEQDVRIETMGFQEGVTKMLNGELDAMFDNAIIRSEALRRAAEGGARFVPIEGPEADHLRREYPFLRVTGIASDLYGMSVRTIGVDGLLICRSDLDEGLVYRLTRQLFASMKVLGRGALRSMDVRQAPATPVPLHPGAARYYRERELSR